MEREKRVEYFENLKSNKKAIGSMDIWYKNGRKTLPVYEIDLEYLIYNRYNGRIASFVKSYEKQTGTELDPTNLTDVEKIENFLWQSNIYSNKATEKSIADHGQLKYGIVTKDGVIIDGNRRAMTLKKVYAEDNPVYFRAVVLEETLDENPKEIMRLETTYQMGEDAKVDYNAIEKYLKCADLKTYGFTNADIAKMMGESSSRIDEYLAIMQLMNEYLDKLGYNGIYTRLDKTEGAFVDLNAYLDRYGGGRSKMIQWNYDESDVNDLKLIYFDYIRGIYNRSKSSGGDSGDSKDYRFIGQTSKKGSFFANKDVWANFRDRHFEHLDPIRESESTIQQLRDQSPTQNLDQLLKSRDETWAKQTDSHLKRNIGLGREALDNINKQNEPLELLVSAKAKLESINTQSKAFLEDEDVYAVVDELRKLTETFKTAIKTYHKEVKLT
jgi:hypothetical protein